MKNKLKTDVLIIGAGPAGTLAAGHLLQAGYQVSVVEKCRFPRFVIGESLLPRCMDHLSEAGLLEAIRVKGFQKKYGAKFIRDQEICDFNFSEKFNSGWDWTWQVPRAEFDEALAQAVLQKGARVDFETCVEKVEFNGSDSLTEVRYVDGTTDQIEARFLIDASGYGRVLPKLMNLDEPSGLPSRAAVFTHVEDKHRSEQDGNRILIYIHQPQVWIWVIPFSNGITSVGFTGSLDFFEAYPKDLNECLRALIAANPALCERLGGVEVPFVMDVQQISNYSIKVKQMFGKGFALAGNATEFLDPVFSSGVTFAMESGSLAAKLADRHLRGENVDWQHEYVDHMNQGINTFRTYVMAWYDGRLPRIFFNKNQEESYKKQICSVLAGYAWDMNNPFVAKHDRAVTALAGLLERQARA